MLDTNSASSGKTGAPRFAALLLFLGTMPDTDSANLDMTVAFSFTALLSDGTMLVTHSTILNDLVASSFATFLLFRTMPNTEASPNNPVVATRSATLHLLGPMRYTNFTFNNLVVAANMAASIFLSTMLDTYPAVLSTIVTCRMATLLYYYSGFGIVGTVPYNHFTNRYLVVLCRILDTMLGTDPNFPSNVVTFGMAALALCHLSVELGFYYLFLY